jgi:nucleoside-diphosphate-sugar epimerase
MRILVTGASGFIGSGLVSALSEAGHDVCALMRPSASSEFLKGVKFTRLSGDLGDQESLSRACENVDAVYHVAGLTAARNKEEFFKFNAEATRNLANAAIKSGSVKKFIFVSSLAAAGPSFGLSPRSETETDTPVSMYGESKLRAELYLDELKGKLNFIAIRPPMVYGPRDKNVFLFFKTIQKQWMPILPAKTPTGHKYYSAIHVDDLITALVAALDAPEADFANGERFFVSDGQIYTYERIMTTIAQELKVKPFRFKVPSMIMKSMASMGSLAGRALNTNFPMNQDKLNELTPDYWICSSQKAFDHFKFKPKHTMESGVPQTIAWYKINGWL